MKKATNVLADTVLSGALVLQGTLGEAQGPSQPVKIPDESVRPFSVHVSNADLKNFRKRIQDTRWPDQKTVVDQSQGAKLSRLQGLVHYWGTDYDWRKRTYSPASLCVYKLSRIICRTRRRRWQPGSTSRCMDYYAYNPTFVLSYAGYDILSSQKNLPILRAACLSFCRWHLRRFVTAAIHLLLFKSFYNFIGYRMLSIANDHINRLPNIPECYQRMHMIGHNLVTNYKVAPGF